MLIGLIITDIGIDHVLLIGFQVFIEPNQKSHEKTNKNGAEGAMNLENSLKKQYN